MQLSTCNGRENKGYSDKKGNMNTHTNSIKAQWALICKPKYNITDLKKWKAALEADSAYLSFHKRPHF
jgi:hypothetical protein